MKDRPECSQSKTGMMMNMLMEPVAVQFYLLVGGIGKLEQARSRFKTESGVVCGLAVRA